MTAQEALSKTRENLDMSTNKLPKGTILTFTGYTDLGDATALLSEGQEVKVIGYGENGAVQVQATDNADIAETLFPDEFKVVEDNTSEAEDTTEQADEKPLAGVTFNPEDSIADLRAVATDKDQKAAGRSKPDVIASLIEMGAVAAEPEQADEPEGMPGGEASEPAVAEAPAEAKGKTIAPVVAVPENTNTQPAIVDSARVQELLAAQDALTAAKSLSEQAEEAFFSLGGVLSHVHETEAYKTLTDEDGEPKYAGKKGFADYAFNELNVNYRKAMNLIAIYRKFRELELDEQRAIRIGWTKLREMIPVMEADNADDLLEYGEEHTRDEIVDHVKVTYVSADEEASKRVKKTRLTFNLFEGNTEVVQNALDAAKELGNVETPEQALVLICAEWGQLTGNIEVPLAEQIAALEARYDVQIGVREGKDRDETVDADERETEAA